jgi:hypothetical protein
MDLLAELQRSDGSGLSPPEGVPQHLHFSDGLDHHGPHIVARLWKVKHI